MTFLSGYVTCGGMSGFIAVAGLIMLWMASGRIGRARELDDSARWMMGITGGGILILLACFWIYVLVTWPY